MALSKINTIKGSLNVITGCGSGLGKATVEWFLKKGSGPILGIDKSFSKDYLDELDATNENKDKLILKTCETFDEVKVEDGLRDFVKKHGSIDNLINVAGVAMAFVMYSKSRSDTHKIDHLDQIMQFNTVGTFNLIRLTSRYMIDENLNEAIRRPKCIVNTSSISSNSPSVGQSACAASNAAIDSMTLCIAREFSSFNIRCNTINVGYFDTRLLSLESKVKEHVASSVALCPERLGHVNEFAHLVQAIIENEMLNGCCIKIDAAAREVPI